MYVLFPETNAAETTAQDSIFLFAERLHAAVGRLDLADQPFGAHLFQTIPVTVGLVSLVEVLRVPAFFRAERKAVMDEFSYQGTSTGKWQRGNFMATMRNIVTF